MLLIKQRDIYCIQGIYRQGIFKICIKDWLLVIPAMFGSFKLYVSSCVASRTDT